MRSRHRLILISGGQLAAEVRKSLNELHKRAIVWLDVKAGNVIIGKNNNTWLIDLGPIYTDKWVDKQMVATFCAV